MKGTNENKSTMVPTQPHTLTDSGAILVSVVIPNKNRLELLERAIDSVLNQDYRHFEIIIVDDSEKDVFESIERKYNNIVNFVIVRGDSRGDAAARSKGVLLSKGSLIAFLDSDDVWMPTKLSSHVKLWQEHPEIGFSWDLWQEDYSAVTKVYGQITTSKSPDSIVSGSVVFAQLWIVGNIIHMSSGIARRKCIEEIGGFPRTNPCDWHLWLLLSSRFDGGFINSVLTQKIISKSSLSLNKKRMLREYRETLRLRFQTFKYLHIDGTLPFFKLLRRFLVMSFYWLYILAG